MKRIFFALFAVICFMGCASKTEPAPKAPQKEAAKEKVRKVPEGWMEVKHKHASYLIPSDLSLSKDTAEYEVFNQKDSLYKTIYSIEITNLSLQEYVAFNIQELPDGVEVKLAKEKKFGNYNVILSVLIVDDMYYVAQITSKVDDTIHNLACGGPLEYGEFTVKICQNILASLELN